MTWTFEITGVKVDVKAADVRAFVQTEPGIQRDLDRRGTRVQQRARQLVGVATGLLFATIRKNRGKTAEGPYVDVIGGKSGRTPYMGYHHDGTEPHIITPRSGRVLRFPSRGKIVFATRVQHPGTRGTFFLTRALRAGA